MQDKSEQVNNLVSKCMVAAAAYGSFIGKDARKTNKQFGVIKKCYLQLRAMESLISLTPLLSNDDESVRLWAAAHLLFIDPEKAQITLRELEQKSGLLAFSAMMTLGEWEKGSLNFDY